MSFFTPIPFVSGPHPSHPLLVFAISTVIFSLAILSLAIQKRPGTGARQALAALHLVSAGLALSLPSTVLVPFNHVLAPAGLIITMHTAALLLIDKQVLSAGETWWSLLRAVYRIWANPRRLQLPTSSSSRRSSDATAATTGTFSRSTARWFALTRCTRAAALLGTRHAAHYLASYYLLVKILRPIPSDFGPDSRGVLPLSARDLGLRAYVSGAWLMDTYVLLGAAHDIFGAVFVWALAWDTVEEWTISPPLFGHVGEARSVRRFWGAFWHRLHLAVFEAYMPAALPRKNDRVRSSNTMVVVVGAPLLRGLCMFAMSAVLHMAADWVVVGTLNAKAELFFFLGNYAVCVAETVVGAWWRGRDARRPGCPPSSRAWGWLCRVVGYAWVVCVLVSLTPGWQYPLVYAAL